MKTPKEYTDNLKNKVITEKMLADCIYSVNKRAKNYREQANKFRNIRDTYNNFEKNTDKKNEMYSLKSKLLKLEKPVLIHEVTHYNEYKEFFSDEYVYNPVENEDYEVVISESYEYLELYEISDKTFHNPIGTYDDREDFKSDLEIVPLEFETYGLDINDLLSMQFVKKVIDLIESKDYTYQKDEINLAV